MTAPSAHIDWESRGVVDLTKVGVYRYAEDPQTRPWLLSWRIGAMPVQRWRWGDPDPEMLLDHVAAGGKCVAHNAAFERVVWNWNVRGQHRLPWPELTIAQVDCTMSRALAVHLPADLDSLGTVLGLPMTKDKEGAALMRRMMRPRGWAADGSPLWHDEAEKIERLGAYCDQDVLVEEMADQRLPPLSPDERALWETDQRINDRGVAFDRPMVEKAVAVLDEAQERTDARMKQVTGGAVERCGQVVSLMRWIASRGIPCASVAGEAHRQLLAFAEGMGDDEVLAAVRLRIETSALAFARGKYSRMLEMACADGRLRGLFSYHRAVTGRWGGSGVQSQNLPRVDADRDLPTVKAVLEIMGRTS